MDIDSQEVAEQPDAQLEEPAGIAAPPAEMDTDRADQGAEEMGPAETVPAPAVPAAAIVTERVDLPPAAAVALETEVSAAPVVRIRPWIRLFARNFDILVFTVPLSFALGFVIGTVYPAFFQIVDLTSFVGSSLWNIFVSLLYMFIEPVLLAAWGTTPGKALLRVRLETQSGQRPTYAEGLHRTFLVYARGLGFYIPIVSFITLINSYNHLTKYRITTWDRDDGFTVSHEDIGVVQGVIFIVIYGGIILLTV